MNEEINKKKLDLKGKAISDDDLNQVSGGYSEQRYACGRAGWTFNCMGNTCGHPECECFGIIC